VDTVDSDFIYYYSFIHQNQKMSLKRKASDAAEGSGKKTKSTPQVVIVTFTLAGDDKGIDCCFVSGSPPSQSLLG